MEISSSWENLHRTYNNFHKLSIDNIEIGEQSPDEKIKFSIYGLLISSEFQKCKYIVENLQRSYPERFEEPLLQPMLNMEWDRFLTSERRAKGGQLWNLKRDVAVYCNGNFMGDDTSLCNYVYTRYLLPMQDFRELGVDALRSFLLDSMSTGRRCIYLTISIDNMIIGTLLFLLYEDIVPKTCRLFLKRCKAVKGGYSNTPIHRIVESSWIQCGGYRLKEVNLPCENYVISHDCRGVLSMCNSGKHKNNTTQFFVTLQKSTWMDQLYVAFGQLIHGSWVLNQIEKVPAKYQEPQKEVMIVRAGEFVFRQQKMGERYISTLNKFLDGRLISKEFKNYYSKNEALLEKQILKAGNEGFRKEYMDSDKKSHKPLVMLPRRIMESFNYVPGKKSSCTFGVENCHKCGCSHDVGKCVKETSSAKSLSYTEQ